MRYATTIGRITRYTPPSNRLLVRTEYHTMYKHKEVTYPRKSLTGRAILREGPHFLIDSDCGNLVLQASGALALSPNFRSNF